MPLTVRLVVLLLAGLVWARGPIAAAEPLITSAPHAHQRSAAGELLIIDVRTPIEWRTTGLPAHAIGINLNAGAGLGDFARQVYAAVGGDLTRPIGLICATGARSDYGARVLQQVGFTNVVHIAEGMAGSPAGPGWLNRALPTQPCRTC